MPTLRRPRDIGPVTVSLATGRRHTADDAIAAPVTRLGAQLALHAHEIGSRAAAVEIRADQPVVLASIFKIVLALGYARQVAAGRLEPTERHRIPARWRTGGVGIGGCADEVELSLRDAARLMMSISDNAAADLLYDLLGQQLLDDLLGELRLAHTFLRGSCRDIYRSVATDLHARTHDEDTDQLDARLAALRPQQLRRIAALDPTRTTSSTANDVAALLDAIWTDRAGPPAACVTVRSLMANQPWAHRLGSGFDQDVQVAAKTGTLPTVRNEAGVVTYPDGRRYAVAVFTQTSDPGARLPLLDTAIGQASWRAIEHLRGCEIRPAEGKP
jgi:beta-lactamase class A